MIEAMVANLLSGAGGIIIVVILILGAWAILSAIRAG